MSRDASNSVFWLDFDRVAGRILGATGNRIVCPNYIEYTARDVDFRLRDPDSISRDVRCCRDRRSRRDRRNSFLLAGAKISRIHAEEAMPKGRSFRNLWKLR